MRNPSLPIHYVKEYVKESATPLAAKGGAVAKLYKPTYSYNGDQRESSVWWFDAYRNGKRIRQSTGKRDKDAAKVVMHSKLSESEPSAPGKLTLADLRKLIVDDYTLNGRKSTDNVRYAFKALEAFFGSTKRASKIDTQAVKEYATHRIAQGRKPATVNRELAALRRAFNLAAESDLVGSVPVIKSLPERNVRKGFVTKPQLKKLIDALDNDGYGILVGTAFVTGWRRGELLSRRWKHLQDGWLVLEPGEAKNEDPRRFPLPTKAASWFPGHRKRVEKALGRPPGPEDYLFVHLEGPHTGQPISRFDASWKAACKEAGLEGLLFHDLRRSAVRTLVQSGIPETIAQRLTGHRSRSVFQRYAIMDDGMLKDAVEKLQDHLW